jgi:GxxExxY protein
VQQNVQPRLCAGPAGADVGTGLVRSVGEIEPRRNDGTKKNEKKNEGTFVYDPIPKEAELLAKNVLDSAFQVHRQLGPGLLESVYERCLCHELQKKQVPFESQLTLPIHYDGKVIEGGLRLDLLVGGQVVVELKSVVKLLPIHEAQLFTYLKLTNNRLGLLINFNVTLLKNGLKRVVK